MRVMNISSEGVLGTSLYRGNTVEGSFARVLQAYSIYPEGTQ